MKAREIKPCIVCGKHPLKAFGRSVTFHVVTFDRALLDVRAARATVGLDIHFGGAPGLADIFSPDPEVVKLQPELQATAVVCEECMADKSLAVVWEAAGRSEQATEEATK